MEHPFQLHEHRLHLAQVPHQVRPGNLDLPVIQALLQIHLQAQSQSESSQVQAHDLLFRFTLTSLVAAAVPQPTRHSSPGECQGCDCYNASPEKPRRGPVVPRRHWSTLGNAFSPYFRSMV
jgi:hypothetical protein